MYAHFSDKRVSYEIKEDPTTYFWHTGNQNRFSSLSYELKTDFGEFFSQKMAWFIIKRFFQNISRIYISI